MDIFGKIRSNRSSMPEVDLSQGRSIAYSRSTTTRLMDVLDANGRGNVHGGVIMRVVDESAAIVAIKHARRPVVTRTCTRIDLMKWRVIKNTTPTKTLVCYVAFHG